MFVFLTKAEKEYGGGMKGRQADIWSLGYKRQYHLPSKNALATKGRHLKHLNPFSSFFLVCQGGERRNFRRQCQVTVFQWQSGFMGKTQSRCT